MLVHSTEFWPQEGLSYNANKPVQNTIDESTPDKPYTVRPFSRQNILIVTHISYVSVPIVYL